MATTVTDALVGQLVDGRYLVTSRIARGGMATVYLATDRRLDREVALKIMHPHLADGASGADFVSRFRREARSAAGLTHPGLVGIYDQGVDGEISYLTMEYIDGTNLRRLLRTEGPLTVRQAFDIVEDVLDALAAAHRKNLVHRDIKPENILLASDGRVKVADFGLARAVTEVTSTATGTILGTVAYLGPELISTGHCDARTDVYAVGVMLYEMLTGTQPFTGASPIQVAFKHVNSDVPAPSERLPWLPAEVDELTCALAARTPADRPLDASKALTYVRLIRSALSEETLDRRGERPVEVAAADADSPQPTAGLGAPHAGKATSEHGDEGQDITALVLATDESRRAAAAAPAEHDDEHATQALWSRAHGSTIALPIIPVPTTEEPGPAEQSATPAEAPPAEPSPTPGRRRRRAVVIWLLAILLVLGAAGGGVYWWFSAGPGHFTTVPEGIVAVPYDDASAVLTAEGLETTRSEAYDDSVAAGVVLSSDPTSGTKIPKDGSVDLKVSLGVRTVTVPAGLTQVPVTDAEAALRDAGFTQVTRGDGEWSTTVPVDVVLSLTVAEGDTLPHNTPITLVVSKGPEPVLMTSVVGLTLDQATEQLADIEVTIASSSEEYSDSVAEGKIISQSVAEGADAHRGDQISVVVSLGRPYVEVPDVVTKPHAEARKQLEALGLEVKVDFWLGFAGNEVRSQSLEPGTQVRKGTLITLKL